MIELTKVTTDAQVAELAELARDIWTEHYLPIIGAEQVDYMLDRFQSTAAIVDQIAQGYEYYVAKRGDSAVGYIAIVPELDQSTLLISKLYVAKNMRRRGCAKKMLAFAEDICRGRGIETLWLTVNKNNVDSISWYERMGFRNVGALVQDIGDGFVMDDYRFEKTVASV